MNRSKNKCYYNTIFSVADGEKGLKIKRLGWMLAMIWTLVLVLALAWNWYQVKKSIHELALMALRVSIEKDLIFRHWAAEHGGVYVPVSTHTPPNPYLGHIQERDITTPSGRQLTLLNPAYIMLQVHELGQKEYGVYGCLASLNPVSPKNIQDQWEAEALNAFMFGDVDEMSTIMDLDGQLFIRLMKPLNIGEECLACNAVHDSQVGDLCCAISVATPLEPYTILMRSEQLSLVPGYALIWILGLVGIGWITRRLEASTRELKESETRYRTIVENTNDALYIHDLNGTIIDLNENACSMLGYRRGELLGNNLSLISASFKHFPGQMEKLIRDKSAVFESTSIRKDDSMITVEVSAKMVSSGGKQIIQSFVRDITERRRTEEALRESEARNRALVEAMPDMLFRYSREGMYLDAEIKDNSRLSTQLQRLFKDGNLIGQKITAVLSPGVAKLLMEAIGKAVATGELQAVEYSYLFNREKLYFEERLMATGKGEVVSIVRDITEQKRFEEKLKYLSFHDHLTGLHNRAYFENELKRLEGSREHPISIVSIDLDGIKLINDTLGHARGDSILKTCAKVLKQSFRSSDIVARVGGDEFVAILPRTDEKTGKEVVGRLHAQVALYNRVHASLPLSVSIGIATAEKDIQFLVDTYKEADDLMYQEKLQKGAAVRDKIIRALVVSLKDKDYIADGHAQRLDGLCRKVGERINLSPMQLSNLALLSHVHDLGKVDIPDEILFKPVPLTDAEWKVIRQHPEKGYRIALSSTDLSGVAELILKHHERWDGGGYPLGLKGEAIPLECRILAIVDAFDAMTSERPYRKVKSNKEAITELKRYAGTQFDSKLLEIFISVLEQE
jgi:diguanylate cyclase (GGDEF)-like protein/PAS domain S-box-containing protein